jgi:predicted nucleotidyltransferase
MATHLDNPIRLRDFLYDKNDWIYSVTSYDNDNQVGCLLRYIPDPRGDRRNQNGLRYRKVGFEEAYSLVAREHPSYAGLVHRIPLSDITQVRKPDIEVTSLAERDMLVRQLRELFSGLAFGVTGSRLVGLNSPDSDIDGVVYGSNFPAAQRRLKQGISAGLVSDLSDELWDQVYKKRDPELSFDEFFIHESRKWNRGQIEDVYFDLLYVRSYADMRGYQVPIGVKGALEQIEAVVADAQFAYDSPAVYLVDHPKYDAVVSFTHTYSGQALAGECIEARGTAETHADGRRWLVIGSTRAAKGEYIKSLSLLESV